MGLKNAGATCYMNSVIQQLYMIPPIRNGILAIEGTGSEVDDDMSGDEKQDNEVLPDMVHFSSLRSVNENFSPYVNALNKLRPLKCKTNISRDGLSMVHLIFSFQFNFYFSNFVCFFVFELAH